MKALKRAVLDKKEAPDYWRPQTYAQCLTLPRPCPYVGCRYHLMLEAKENGSIMYHFQDVTSMKNTCALDMSDLPKSEKETAALLNMTVARMQQLQRRALGKIKESLPSAVVGR